MKKLIAIVAGALLLNLSALAQGTILFQNFGPGINSYAAALAAGKAYLPGPVFHLVAGGGLSGLGNPTSVPSVPAPALFGMPGYIIPEPSTIVLGVLGAAVLLLLRRK